MYAAGFGCFDLKPAAGVATIGHNFARGPAAVNVALRLARTWAFGGEGRSGPAQQTSGGAMHGGGNGPPAGLFDTKTGRRYNLTVSASTLNALNRANFAPPILTTDTASAGTINATLIPNRQIQFALRLVF